MVRMETFAARVAALPRTVRVGGAAALAAVIVIAVIAGVAAHPARVPLFSQKLFPEQVLEVQERLAAWNVPFTPLPDNIVVDAQARNTLLLRLSLGGIPHTHVASSGEALASVGALTPQSVIDEQARTGLAGDIELGLRGIDGIDDARVIVAPATQAQFADQTSHDASASVRLTTRAGARLSRDAIDGIRRYVAAAVPGLDPAHVTIVDDRGIALGAASSGEDDASDLQRALQSALDTAFGSGVALVRVRIDRDPRATSSTTQRRVPLSASAITSSSNVEQYSGDGKRYDKDVRTEDRGSLTSELTTTQEAGGVARVSAAVFVDARRAADLAAVRAFAAATLGVDTRRGDTLAVQAVDFTHEPAGKRDGWWLAYGAIVPLLPTLVWVIGALVALRVAYPPLLTLARTACERASIARARRSVAGYAPANVRRALAGEPPHAVAAVISALPAATAAAVLDLYPPHERSAIVTRMQRAHASFVPQAHEVLLDA